ncbi:MAG TPA: ABC transporter permease, partial [Gemmataceae bacterium]|nr:ABC transporter permease [Gemmataceae bacterium]
FLLLVYVVVLLSGPEARGMGNHFNLARRIGLFGILSLGAGILIISGGIDLSMGSVVGLSATLCALFLEGKTALGREFLRITGSTNESLTGLFAIGAVLIVGALIGLLNGLLVTKVRVQAFVVTLCGLFIYRGAARWVGRDSAQGLGVHFPGLKRVLYSDRQMWGLLEPLNKYLISHQLPAIEVPVSLVLFLILAAIAIVFLHFSVFGRYLYAIGSNERAARYSGIATDRYKILAYVLCSTLAACFGALLLMQENSAQPSGTGNFLELYAIAGAVLGGCSLRGGEGNVFGIGFGASILVLLADLTNMWEIPSSLEFIVIGGALLLGATLDEVLRRFGAGRSQR